MKHRTIKQQIRRFFKSSSWLSIQIFAFIIVFILLLPIIIPLLPVLVYFDDRQKLKAADRFPCTNCGQILGQPALELADRKWHKLMSRMHSENPDIKFRPPDRTVHAICTRCNTRFTYSAQTKIFTRASGVINNDVC